MCIYAYECTGKHLSELCKVEYPSPVKYCLWVLAELAVIAADIPEGTFFLDFFFVSQIIYASFLNFLR